MQTESVQHAIEFGSSTIQFDLIHSNRKTLGIFVRPDSTIYVRAPFNSPMETILERVRKKTPWILKQLNRFDKLRPLNNPKDYVSGESFYYLGRQYRLKVIRNSEEEHVKMSSGFINVMTYKKDKERIKYLLDRWYSEKAKSYFAKRMVPVFEKAKPMGIHPNKISIRNIKTRWGSCSRKGNISLNVHLIKAPSHCIDYVIMHEVCHLKIFNHSKAYYDLLNKMMPDWELRKKRLESVII